MKEHKIIDVEDRHMYVCYSDHSVGKKDKKFHEVDANKTIASLAKEGWTVKQVISKKEKSTSFDFSYGTEFLKITVYTILFEREGERKNDD